MFLAQVLERSHLGTCICLILPNYPDQLRTKAALVLVVAKGCMGWDLLPVVILLFRLLCSLFMVDPLSRRVAQFGLTSHSTDEWVTQQLREAPPFGQAPRFLTRDRDSKYGEYFTRVAVGTSNEVLKTLYRAPKANAVCGRFLGSVRRERLNYMLVVGEKHLYRIVKEYVDYFNRARPHQGIEQQIPEGSTSVPEKRGKANIIAFSVLNGLRYDYRMVALG